MQNDTIGVTTFAPTHTDLVEQTSKSSVIYSLLLLVPGITAFVLLSLTADKSSAYSMGLLTVGIAFIFYAIFHLVAKSKVLVYKPSGSAVSESCLYFDTHDLPMLTDVLNGLHLPSDKVAHEVSSGNVRLNILLSQDQHFAALQLFHYVPYNYTSMTPVKYFTGSDAKSIFQFLARCRKS